MFEVIRIFHSNSKKKLLEMVCDFFKKNNFVGLNVLRIRTISPHTHIFHFCFFFFSNVRALTVFLPIVPNHVVTLFKKSKLW